MSFNGSSGIPVAGREVEYATELWLQGPSAFWLHPEGPLSDKTREEWLEERRAEEERRRQALANSMPPNLGNAYAQMALQGQLQAALAAQRNYTSAYMQLSMNPVSMIFGKLI